MDKILLAALPIETQRLTEKYIHTVYTGVGKVNAAIKTTEAIYKLKPMKIINYGTAGSHTYQQGNIIDCTKFVQRDIDVSGLGFNRYETPFDDDIPQTLKFESPDNLIGKNATCYTGDTFVMDRSLKYEVVDMEAYAIAKSCYLNNVEFISYKYISDGADENSKSDWEGNCIKGIKMFLELMWPGQ